MNCTAYPYYVTLIGQMHIYLITKIITKHNVLPCTDSNQPVWFHIETNMRALSCNLPMQLLLISLSSQAKPCKTIH